MGILREQLMELGFEAKGLVVPDLEKQIEAINQKKPMLSDHFTCEDLERCSTVNEFKRVAKNILFADWSLAQEIVNKAHSFKGEDSKKLIRFCFQVRDGLKKCPSQKIEQFLNRAFRRSGATFEISEDWLR